MNILEKFEIKLKQNIETFRIQNKQSNESEVRFKREDDERQRVHHLYETQLQKCRQLTDLISKLETDSKIECEKQSIEFKEQKNLNVNQIERLSQQISQLKHDLNAIQSKCWHLEQTLLRKESQLQKHTTYQLTIDSQISEMKATNHSLSEELNTLSQNQMQLKDIVKSTDRLNVDLRAQLNECTQQLNDVNKDNSALKALVIELKEKCRKREESLDENQLQTLRFSQRLDLQKQETDELRALLDESNREKLFLTKKFNKTPINSNELTECESSNEDSIQSPVITP